MLGKALNDPVANLSAMSRAGIQFSEDQKEVIKSLAESGDMAQAQSIILEELEKQYGGSAEAAAKAGTGGLKQLANAFGDLQEEFGKVIMDFMPPVIDGLKNMLAAFQNLSPQAKRFMVIGSGIAAALGPLLVLLPSLIQGFMALLSPVGLIVGAIVALGIAIVTFADEVAVPITAVANYFITLYNESAAVRAIIGAIKGTVQTVFDFFAFAVNNVIESFKDLGAIIKAIFTGDFAAIPQLISTAFSDAAARTAEFGKKAAENMRTAIEDELKREPIQLLSKEGVAQSIKTLGGLTTMFSGMTAGGPADTAGAGAPAVTVPAALNIVDIDMPEDVVEDEDIDAVIAASTAVQNRVNAMAQSVAGFVDHAFQQIASGTATFEQVMLDMLKRLAMQLASLIAQFVVLSVLLPGAGVVKGGLGKFIGGGFGLPMMANGGLFTGASLAMVGEGSGTSSINPEVVAPLDRLQSMMGAQQVQVTGRISGRDILLTSERNAIDRNRVRGF
jgi:DNA-binding protein YbaB